MSHYDTVIANGTVATADWVRICDIAVSEGRIAAIGEDLGDCRPRHRRHGQDRRAGWHRQPRPHFAALGRWHRDGRRFRQRDPVRHLRRHHHRPALRAPAARRQPARRGDGLSRTGRRQLPRRCQFPPIVTDPTPQVLRQELQALVADGYTSFKVFVTYENLRLHDRGILETLDVARDTGALVMVHCENEDAIRFLIDRHVATGEVEPKFHAASRPVVAEREATHRAISLAEVIEAPLVIVHVSNRPAMEEIARAEARGRTVVGETCPQYLVLTAYDLDDQNWEGAKFVCSPPPRDSDSQAACWEGLQDGTFELFSSDHCPFRYDDPEGKLNAKGERDFRWIPNGIPGVETRLPILFSEGVSKGRIDLSRFVALGSTNHAKTYRLYPQKGEIAVGSDADIAIWDPEVERPITQERLHHGADYTPYEGLVVRGWPVSVLLRGELVVEGGEPTSVAPTGRHLPRGHSELVPAGAGGA